MNTEQEKIQTLQNILTGCDYDIKVADYDLTQQDSMDEQGSNGAWDLAGTITNEILDRFQDTADEPEYQAGRATLQTLLYNLICVFKTEQKDE